MSEGRRRYLVAYDIRDPRRLRQVHKTLKEFGWAMQYSVFVADLDRVELVELRLALSAIIDHRSDTIALIDVGLPAERGRHCFEFLGVPSVLPTSGPLVL
jgi:CRISPR-associated protein Cas2